MALADDIGNLILNLNPYTNDPDSGRNRSTGQMNPYVGNPSPTDPPTGTLAEMQVEIDNNYPGEWSFKGEPQRINTAVRIPYRYPVYGAPTSSGSKSIIYWVTDYLLIGFEGAGGGN